MIQRSEHKELFFPLSNDTARDTELSDGAFRLLVFMLSMSDDWFFSVKGLASQLNWSVRKVMRLVCELKKAGYIVQRLQTDERGRFLPSSWVVYETAIRKTCIVDEPQYTKTAKRTNRTTVEPQCGKSVPIRNTNIKEIPKKEEIPKYKKAHALGIFQNVILTDSEQEDLCKHWGFDEVVVYIDRLSVYLNQHPEKNYKNHKATIDKWIGQDKERKIV